MNSQRAGELGAQAFAMIPKFDAIPGTTTSEMTLRMEIFGKFYSKTMPFKDYQDESRVTKKWSEVFQLFKQDFPTGNVPVVITNPEEDDMSKEEAISKFHSTIEAQETMALGQLFDDGKAEGGNFTKEEVDQAVRDAIAALPADTTPFDQAYVTEAVAKGVAEALAALPADQTPFSKEDMDKAVADALATAPTDASLSAELAALKDENKLMKLAIQAEIDDSKVDTSRLESVLAPVLPQGEPAQKPPESTL